MWLVFADLKIEVDQSEFLKVKKTLSFDKKNEIGFLEAS